MYIYNNNYLLHISSSFKMMQSTSFSPNCNFTDREPTDDDLDKFVAKKVPDSGGLGIMLRLETVQIEMIRDDERRAAAINRKILAQWKEEGTRKPVTWRTLISALQDMKMNSLAHQLMEKFGK